VTFWERLRALGWFLLAAAWFLFADMVAFRAAAGMSYGHLLAPLYHVFDLFLLAMGYWVMSRVGQRTLSTGRATGLWLRPGWRGEFALGAAIGWSGVVACVLPIALIGGMMISVDSSPHQWLVLILDTIALGAGTLAVEVAFRGYGFQRLTEAMGPTMAAVFMAAIYAVWRTHTSQATGASLLVSFLLGLVLAIAVLRTRALWVGWGFHFAWAAAMSLLFGLPMSGPMDYSPVILTNPVGPRWITGDGLGPEASAFGILVVLLLLYWMASLTTDLKYKYGFDEIVSGGVPVDIDAAARQAHEAAMRQVQTPAQTGPQLVQIQGIAPAAAGRGAAPGQPAVAKPGSLPETPEEAGLTPVPDGASDETPEASAPDESEPGPQAS
jgi:hypothetical protein